MGWGMWNGFSTSYSKMLFPEMSSTENWIGRRSWTFILILGENANSEYSTPSENLYSTAFCFWGGLNFLDEVYFLKFGSSFGGVKPRFFVQVWNLSHALIFPSFLSPPPTPPSSYPAHNLSLTQILSEPPEKGAL